MPERGERMLQDQYSTKTQGINVFDPRVVQQIHKNADTDTGQTAIHHTLGPAPDQAASGTHTHDGNNSRQLLAGVSITGSRGGNVALASVIDALEALGATDNTTA